MNSTGSLKDRPGRNLVRLAAFLLVALLTASGQLAVAKAKNRKPIEKKGAADYTPLMTAALNCNAAEVNRLIGQGSDVRAVDSKGESALAIASRQQTMKKKDGYLLVCPQVVSALLDAGSQPNEATFFQSPSFEQNRPNRIAVLRVVDEREERIDNEKTIKGLTAGVEQTLSQKMPRVSPVIAPHYPILKLSETRERLKAAGWADDDVMRPDPLKACPVLDVDAVFEAHLRDFSHGVVVRPGIIGSKSGANLEFDLIDCRKARFGQLLWRAVDDTFEARGFLLKGFNGFTLLSEQVIKMPRYRGAGK